MVDVLTATSASPQTWTPAAATYKAGDVIHIEAWGAGAGASGSSTSFRSGGAGGCWAETFYPLTLADCTNGIAYTLQAGSAGTGAANPTVGPDTIFGVAPKNLIQNSSNYGAVVGTTTLPFGWAISGATFTVAALGVDTGTGLKYIDITFSGTTTSANIAVSPGGTNANTATPMALSLAYTASVNISATNQTNITGSFLQFNYNTTAGAFISTANVINPLTISTTLTRRTGTATSPATTGQCSPTILLTTAGVGTAVSFTLRIAGLQIEQSATFTSFLETPTSYVLAKGGAGPIGTAGGISPPSGDSYGTKSFKGGNGAPVASSGGGGGGAGKDGAGTTASSGTGGTGDAGSGGAANTANVEGGGGGSNSSVAGTPGHAGGDPAGGGGANTSTGTGGAGGRGQIRITNMTALQMPFTMWPGLLPVMVQ